MYKNIVLLICVLLFLDRPVNCSPLDEPLAKIDVTLIDDDAIGYATFQSHNQKVTSNDRGMFMTHIRSANAKYRAQQWRLSQSTDGGKSFTTIHQQTHPTNPPVLESDANNNIYLIRPDFANQHGYLDRFVAGADHWSPVTTAFASGAAGKFTMVLDQSRGQLYYFVQNSWFHIVDFDGNLRKSYRLLQGGAKAYMMYPFLAMSEDGTIYAAWFTQDNNKYLYWSIHVIASHNGGLSWQNLDGTPLTTPIIDDNTGPTDMINYEDELQVGSPLSAFIVKNDKLHFVYWAQTAVQRQRYVRYDIATGKKDIDVEPFFYNWEKDISNFAATGYGDCYSSFFASRASEPDATLYFVQSVVDKARLGCYASDDNGQTWYEYAVGDATDENHTPWATFYSLGGAREITKEGCIIGCFTHQNMNPEEGTLYSPGSKVYFLKIQAGLSSAKIASLHYTGVNLNISFDNARGQPQEIRFSDEGGQWSKWHTFSEVMNVILDKQPVKYQLKSQLGIESRIVGLGMKETAKKSYVIPKVIGRKYRMVMRAMYVPFKSSEQLEKLVRE